MEGFEKIIAEVPSRFKVQYYEWSPWCFLNSKEKERKGGKVRSTRMEGRKEEWKEGRKERKRKKEREKRWRPTETDRQRKKKKREKGKEKRKTSYILSMIFLLWNMSNLIIYRAVKIHIRALPSWVFCLQPTIRAFTRIDVRLPCHIIIMFIPANAWLYVPNTGQAMETRTPERVQHGSESLAPISSQLQKRPSWRFLLSFIALTSSVLLCWACRFRNET